MYVYAIVFTAYFMIRHRQVDWCFPSFVDFDILSLVACLCL